MTNLVLIGFGPVGQMICSELAKIPDMALVGVVDKDPNKIGKPVKAYVEHAPWPLHIVDDLGLVKDKAEVALVATASRLTQIRDTLETCAKRGLHVVSTCEELVFPWVAQQNLAADIDRLATNHGVSFLGTGVNPGFLMDYLPVLLTSLCPWVASIEIERIQDAKHRRLPFQQKIGAGLSVEAFEAKLASGAFGHVGLRESAHMVAKALGWSLEKVGETTHPVVGSDGAVRGIQQALVASDGTHERIKLLFRASMDEPNPRDKVVIHSDRRMEFVIPGATHGDIATISVVINASRKIRWAKRGLVSMLDMPAIHAIGKEAPRAHAT